MTRNILNVKTFQNLNEMRRSSNTAEYSVQIKLQWKLNTGYGKESQ
jgi:hypothetical protein